MWAGNPSSYSSYSDAKESRLQWIWIEVLMEKDPQQIILWRCMGPSLCVGYCWVENFLGVEFLKSLPGLHNRLNIPVK